MEDQLNTCVKEGLDPRGGTVALFFGRRDEDDVEEGFWVENQRTENYSDFLSEEDANDLYELELNNSQTY